MYCSYVSVGRWILPVLSTWCADSCVCVCVCHWLPLLLLLLLHGLQQRKEQPSADVIGYLVVLNISAHKTISTSQLLRWELNVGLMSIFSSSLISKFSVGLIIKSNAGLISKFNVVLISKTLNEIYDIKAAVTIYTTCFNIRISNTNSINLFRTNRTLWTDSDRPVLVMETRCVFWQITLSSITWVQTPDKPSNQTAPRFNKAPCHFQHKS